MNDDTSQTETIGVTGDPRDNNPLLVAAQAAAKDQVRGWIRAALRETALQALKVNLIVRQQDGEANAKTIIDISEGAFKAAQGLCRRVAIKWGEKLLQAGHYQVATWIDDMVETEQATLFFQKNTADPSNGVSWNALSTQNDPTSAAIFNESASPHRDAAAAGLANADPAEATVTAWAELRRLGEYDPCAPDKAISLSMREAIAVLDRVGESNVSYWPADRWNFIQEAVSEIPARLHGSTVTRRSDGEAAQLLKLAVDEPNEQIIANSDNDQLGDARASNAPQHHSEAVQLLLDRKRKSSNKKRHNRPIKRLRVTASPESSSAPTEPPRAPSQDDGTANLHWERDIRADHNWSSEQKTLFNACFHEDAKSSADWNEEQERPCLLLGALRDIGRSHYFSQLLADFDDGVSAVREWTDKQRRRRQREAVQVRLGDHRQIRDEAKKARMSRVIRTIESVNKDDDGSGRYWFDLDLGHCLLEDVDASTGRRTLFAFGSVELLLLDENKDDDIPDMRT